MFKKLFAKLARKVGAKPVMAEMLADKADDAVMDVLDAKTGGLASAAEKAVKQRRDARGKFSK